MQSQLEILIFIDFNPALGTLLRGCSRQSDWNCLVAEIWFAAASRGDILCAFRVPSAQNLADAPSRAGSKPSVLDAFFERGFEEVQWLWPEKDFWE